MPGLVILWDWLDFDTKDVSLAVELSTSRRTGLCNRSRTPAASTAWRKDA